MSAFVVVDLTPLDAEKLKEYSAEAAVTVARHNGEFVARGPTEPLTGGTHHKFKAIIRFSDRASAQNLYQSDEYQALIPLRDEAMDAVFHLVG